MTETRLKDDLGIDAFSIDDPDNFLQALWYKPTLDCNGVIGGYTQEGAKTIIPAKASAKISMRLVANQDPHKIADLFQDYVNTISPAGVRVDVDIHTLAYPAKMEQHTVYMKAASEAFEFGFGNKPYFVGEGGTIPVVASFKHVLGVDTVMMGFNCPDDAIHSPNERFLEDSFYKGIATSMCFLTKLGDD